MGTLTKQGHSSLQEGGGVLAGQKPGVATMGWLVTHFMEVGPSIHTDHK